jgi:membrane protein implicated in regulation of membrane protease activity
MYLLQSLIICAVVGSNIHWQWTPNPYLAAGIGVFLAWVATQVNQRVARSQRSPLESQKEKAADARAALSSRIRNAR